MEGCAYKENKWRKNTCSNCYQAKSAHSNVPSDTTDNEVLPRSESWDVKRSSATLPQRHSNRYSTGSNISVSSIGLQRSTSSASKSTSSSDLSKPSVERTSQNIINGALRKASPPTNRNSVPSVPATTVTSSSAAGARTTGSSSSSSRSSSSKANDSMESAKHVAAKPPTARKPPVTSLVRAPSNRATATTAGSPPTPGVTTKQDENALGNKDPRPRPRPSRKSPAPTQSSSVDIAAAASVSPALATTIGGRHATSETNAASQNDVTAPRIAQSQQGGSSNGSRSPGESTTAAEASPRTGSRSRQADERTLLTSSSAANSRPGRSKTDYFRVGSSSGAGGAGRGGAEMLKADLRAAPAEQHRPTVDMSSVVLVNGAANRPAALLSGQLDSGEALTSEDTHFSSSSSSSDDALGSAAPADRKLAPAKPGRSKLSYSASPELIRAHASMTEPLRPSPVASPARGPYEDIWTPTKTLPPYPRGQSQFKEKSGSQTETTAKPQAKARAPLSPQSSVDLERPVADADQAVSGQKRPAVVSRTRAPTVRQPTTTSSLLGSQDPPAVPPVHNYTEVSLISRTTVMSGNVATVVEQQRHGDAADDAEALATAKADTESVYSVPGAIRPFSPSDGDADGGAGSEADGAYRSPRRISGYSVPRPSSSASNATLGDGNVGAGLQRSVSEVVVAAQKPQAPARSKSRSAVSQRPKARPPPPPAVDRSPPEVRADGSTAAASPPAVTVRRPSTSEGKSPPAVRRNTIERTKRHTIAGKPNRLPPPPPPSSDGSQPQRDSSPSPPTERRKSICTPPPSRKVSSGRSSTAPAALDILLKSMNDASSSVSKLSPKIGTKVWKNLRKTHDRTMSMIRARRPGGGGSRKASQSQLDMSDDDTLDTSRASSAMDASPPPTTTRSAALPNSNDLDSACRTPTPGDCYGGEGSDGGSPETAKALPPRKPVRTASSFRRSRRNIIPPPGSAAESPVSGDHHESSSSPSATVRRAGSNDTTGSLASDTASHSSTQSLRNLIDASLAGIGDSLPPLSGSGNALPLPPKPLSRFAAQPSPDAPALPPRQPEPGIPPQPMVSPRRASGKPAPPAYGQRSASSPQLLAPDVPERSPAHSLPPPPSEILDLLSATPTPPTAEQELERELALVRADAHALARSTHRSLGNVVKRLSRCACEERRKAGSVPKNWSHIEVLGCEDDGPHGTCSIHVLFKTRDGKVPMTAQLEPLLTGNEDDALLYARDCAVRDGLEPHCNVMRTQAKFREPVPELVHDMLELGLAPGTACSCYVTESTADYADAEVFFASLGDQEVPPADVVSQTAFVFVQICSAVQHLAASGIVHRNLVAPSIMIGPVTDRMSPITSGDLVLLTSFGHALSLPPSPDQPSSRNITGRAQKLVFKRADQQDIMEPRRTDILPPEIRLHMRAKELDFSGCDAYSLGMLMRSVIDVAVLPVFQRICKRLCLPKLAERCTVRDALRAFQCTLWGPTEAEVPGWTSPQVPLDRDRLCSWLDTQRCDRLGAMALKLCRFKVSLEDLLQCTFLSSVSMDELVSAQENFFIGT